MAFDIGLNFRQTDAYVTDPTDSTYVLPTDPLYPVTRGGATFGWLDAGYSGRNRSLSIDPRLAGIHFTFNDAAKRKFRLDLPASGSVDVYCAVGDAGAVNNGYLELFDDTSSLGVLVSKQSVSAVTFNDATDTNYSAANWPASNSPETHTFSTTKLIVAVTPGDSTGGNYVISHLRAVQSSGGSVVTGVGSSSGVATVSGAGSATSESSASSSGSSTVTGSGASVSESVGSSAGVATASGVGASSTAGSAGSAAGTSTASGISESSAESTGTAAGIVSVNGVSASDASGSGVSAGIATVSGAGDSSIPGAAVGAASGTSTVSGVGASVALAVGSSSGSSTAQAVSGNVVERDGGDDAPIRVYEKVRKRKKPNQVLDEILDKVVREVRPTPVTKEIKELAEKSAALVPSQTITPKRAPVLEFSDKEALLPNTPSIEETRELLAKYQAQVTLSQMQEDEELLMLIVMEMF